MHLAEIDERKLYLERACPSMFAFCVERLGFSEDAAYSRILVARAGRKLPELFGALGSGRVHLTGLRLLAPHLTEKNHREVLAQAVGKSKREIEELVATIAPKPEDTFKVQFSVSRGFRDKLRHAQDLLRHRIPDGDIAAIMERALDLLIAQVKKERFAVGRKGPQVQSRETPSRHIPDAINQYAAEQLHGAEFMKRPRAPPSWEG